MSSTGRGLARIANDYYPTPKWLVQAIISRLAVPHSILEPACGDGVIVDVLKESFPLATICASDIVTGDDFLKTVPNPTFDLIITNPPFSLAQQFVDRAMLWRRNEESQVAMLLRLNFLGARKRAAWWRSRPMPAVYVSPRRPRVLASTRMAGAAPTVVSTLGSCGEANRPGS